MAVEVFTSRKAAEPISSDTLLIHELDTLQDLSRNHRDDFLGPNFFSDVRKMYNLQPPSVSAPTYRPYVSIPQFQQLMMQEASDLADTDPTIYIVGPDGKRDKERENAFMGQWRRGYFSMQILFSSLWSLLGGTGFLQCGFDPLARSGRGETYLRWRDPDTCFPDPASSGEMDWYYFQLEERLWPDEIKRRFPRAYTTGLYKPVPASGITTDTQGFGSGRFQMPPGPMSAIGNQPNTQPIGPSDGRRKVRYTFVYDSNVTEIVKESAGTSTAIERAVPAKFELMFPNGRYMVDCDGAILYDSHNPHPMGSIPIARVQALPSITSFWCPPPMRFSYDLQSLAERMLRQVFENFVRTNNCIWVLDDASGLTRETFSAMPGEIVEIESGGRAPQLLQPNQFPAHFLNYPQFLLNLQKELQGFPPSREGKTGTGNVGSELFDSAVMQSQAITRLRTKLLAMSIQRVSELAFYTMAKYQGQGRYPSFESGFQLTDWTAIAPEDQKRYEVFLDPSSIRPMSANALRKLVPELRKLQMVDTRSALEMLGIPGATDIADNIEAEKALEALSRLKKR